MKTNMEYTRNLAKQTLPKDLQVILKTSNKNWTERHAQFIWRKQVKKLQRFRFRMESRCKERSKGNAIISKRADVI